MSGPSPIWPTGSTASSLAVNCSTLDSQPAKSIAVSAPAGFICYIVAFTQSATGASSAMRAGWQPFWLAVTKRISVTEALLLFGS